MPRLAVFASMLTAVVLVAACGLTPTPRSTSGASLATDRTTGPADNSTLDPATLFDKVLAAMDTQAGFTLRGTGPNDNGHPFSIAVRFGERGSTGSFTENGYRYQVVGLEDDSVYLRASAQAWRALIDQSSDRGPDVAGDAASLARYWVQAPDASPFTTVVTLASRHTFVQMLTGLTSNIDTGALVNSGTSSVNGVAAVVFTNPDGGARVYVAAHGAPLLLGIHTSDATWTFGNFDVPYYPELPGIGIDYTSVVR